MSTDGFTGTIKHEIKNKQEGAFLAPLLACMAASLIAHVSSLVGSTERRKRIQ